MVFVNEFATENDIKKYHLDELKAKHDWFAWREGRPEGYQHSWTVDHENDTFLIFAKTVMDTGPSGRHEPTRETILVLGIGDITFKITLYKHESSSIFTADSPYRIVWRLIDIEGDFEKHSRVKVLEKLRAALACRGNSSAWPQFPNTVVECLF